MNTDNNREKDDFTPSVISVSALNQAVSRTLERSFPLAWIAGEISNFTRATSGHWYFTLKDDTAQVRAVMFRGRSQFAGFMPRDGDKVEVRALVTLYAARGDYQINVETIRRSGVGGLYEAFLKLKEKLSKAGFFDSARKRELPYFVKTIGIVTSPQAAALRDILTTLKRRAPHVEVILYPTPVQGDGAAEKIAEAINTASVRAECSVLLVCRGGGSAEDLWSFNDETVARAIVTCTMPVITGIGHETDFTIADFTADMRAPTPTAAAELAATPRDDYFSALEGSALRLSSAMRRRLGDTAQSLDWLSRRLISPSNYIAHERMKLQGLSKRLYHATQTPLSQKKFALLNLRTRCVAQLPDTATHRLQLTESARRITASIKNCNATLRQKLAASHAQLEMLNPQRTLDRGYAIIQNQQGNVVRNPSQIKIGQYLDLRLAEGEIKIAVANSQGKLDGM